MNALIALVALTLANPAQAESHEIRCHSTNVADAGYLLEISPDRSSATLEEQSFIGPRPLAKMKCETVRVTPIADGIHSTLLCRADRIGGGLFVRLYEGGIFFQRTARLTKFVVTRHGLKESPVQFGNMNCSTRF